MGGGNKVDTTRDYKEDRAAAKVKTPGEILLEEQSAKALGWAAKGDYRDPHEAGLFLNFADPSMQNRNRELTMNTGGQGIFGLGNADPNYLAAVKENVKAHQAESDAAGYEADIKEGVSNAAAIAGDAERLDQARKFGVMNTSADLYKQQAARPKWWETTLGMIGQVGAGLAA